LQVLSKFPGKELENKTYTPLFPYFKHFKERGGFRVLCDGYVRADSGTGVVHQAPAFGEDDYRIGIQNGELGLHWCGRPCPLCSHTDCGAKQLLAAVGDSLPS
jgi:isoleucyl-tRNA synthetase